MITPTLPTHSQRSANGEDWGQRSVGTLARFFFAAAMLPYSIGRTRVSALHSLPRLPISTPRRLQLVMPSSCVSGPIRSATGWDMGEEAEAGYERRDGKGWQDGIDGGWAWQNSIRKFVKLAPPFNELFRCLNELLSLFVLRNDCFCA